MGYYCLSLRNFELPVAPKEYIMVFDVIQKGNSQVLLMMQFTHQIREGISSMVI